MLGRLAEVVLLDNDQAFGVDENAAVGTAVGTVVSSDPDGDPRTYAITAGNGPGPCSFGSSNRWFCRKSFSRGITKSIRV